MLLPALNRFHRKRGYERPEKPAAVALTLASATYDHTALTLTLVFDRAVNIGGLDGQTIQVDDAVENNVLYEATGGTALLGPDTVRLTLVALEVAGGPGVLLYASAFTGIIAASGGGTWAGAGGLALPFP